MKSIKGKVIAFGIFGALMVGCGQDSQKEIIAKWNLVALNDNGTAISLDSAEEPVFVTFDGQKINGNAGCNNFFGNYTLKDNTLMVQGVGMTRKMCSEESMAIEDSLIKVFADGSSQANINGAELVIQKEGIKATFKK